MLIIHTGAGLSSCSAKSPLPPPNPSIHSSHPFLWRYLTLYLSTHYPEIPVYALLLLSSHSSIHIFLLSFSLSSPSFPHALYFSLFFSSFLLSISVPLAPSVISTCTLENTLFCKSNKTARVLHLMDARTLLRTHSDPVNAG